MGNIGCESQRIQLKDGKDEMEDYIMSGARRTERDRKWGGGMMAAEGVR
jgi:hypothetical protein